MKKGSLLLTAMLAMPLAAGTALGAGISPSTQTVPEKSAVGLTMSGNTTGCLFAWSKIAGPDVTLGNTSTKQLSFIAPEVGPSGAALTFKVVVTGGGCASAGQYTAPVNVVNVNKPPVAAIADIVTPVNEAATVKLDGSLSSDPDGDALTYSWLQTAGPHVDLSLSSDGSAATFTAPNDVPLSGVTLEFQLTVSDGILSSSAIKDISVKWVNDPPEAVVGCPASVDEGTSVTLLGSGSTDSDDGIVSYSWIQTNGGPVATLPEPASAMDSDRTFTAPTLNSQFQTMTFGLTVTDYSGLFNSKTCDVKVNDITPPALSGTPKNEVVEATSINGAPFTFSMPTALDLVDGVREVTCSAASGDTFPLNKTTAVTCSASDLSNNSGSASFTVSVKDTTPPALSGVPADLTVEATSAAGSVATYTAPTATDIVDGAVNVTCTPLSGATFQMGTTQVSCSTSDKADNSASAVFSVKVQDTTPPVVTPPVNPAIAEATGPLTAVAIGNATGTDAVGVVSLTNDAPAAGYPIGTTTVKWTAMDAAGNLGYATESVTVRDTTPPVVTSPANPTAAEATGPLTKVAIGTATATDAIGVVSLTNDAPAAGYPVGNTTVKWTAMDAAGNIGYAIETVTVKDTSAPYFTNIPEQLTGINGAPTTFSSPTATDLVDGNVAVQCTPASGSIFALGKTTVSCSATDTHNNSASASFTVNMNYGFGGLLSPYDASKSYKIKSTIPLKWQYKSSTGAVLASAGAAPTFAVYKVTNNVEASTVVDLADAGASGLQYDGTSNTWQYNWKTTQMTAGTYDVYIISALTGQKDFAGKVQLAN
jgi:hypothetical protein